MKSILQPNGVAAAITLFVSFSLLPNAKADDAAASLSALGPSPEEGLALDGWLVYPSLFIGSVFNDNVHATSVGRRAAVGVRVRPSIQGKVDNGLHKTTAYLSADAQIYPGLGAQYTYSPAPAINVAPTNVTARAGVAHVWAPLSDLNVYVTADFTRQNGLFGSNFGAGAPPVYVSSGYTIAAAQQYSNQFSGSVAVEKNFQTWFARATTGVQYVSYDSRPSSAFPLPGYAGNNGYAQNGLTYTASLRGGVWITPAVYGFVEPTLDLRRYENSISDTNGYRVIGGLGSDLFGLFRGEVYGGYQSQSSDRGLANGTISRPTYGARLFYYPTRYLTVSATLDQTLAAAAAPSQTAAVLGQWSPGSSNVQTRVQVDYAFSPYWTTYVRGGFGETRWTNSARNDTAWAGGAGLNYTFWRNVALSLDYQFQQTSSNSGSLFNYLNFSNPTSWGYVQNTVSLGVTYRY